MTCVTCFSPSSNWICERASVQTLEFLFFPIDMRADCQSAELKAKWANYANTKCFFRVGSSYSQEDHCKRHSVGLPWTCQATPLAQGHGKHQHISRHAGLTITIHYQYCMILPKTVPKSTASQFLSYNFVKARVCSWGWSFCCRSCCWWWGWSIMMDADASW